MNRDQEEILVKSMRLSNDQNIDGDRKEMRCGDDMIGVFVSSGVFPMERDSDLLIVGEALYDSLSTTKLDFKSILQKSRVHITIAQLATHEDPQPDAEKDVRETLRITGIDFDVSRMFFPSNAFLPMPLDSSNFNISNLKLLFAQYAGRQFDQIWCNPCPSICNSQHNIL